MTNEKTSPQQAPVTFSINAQYIRDLSFEGPAHPDDAASPNPPKIEVNVAAQTRALDENLFEVVLSTRAEAKMEGKHAFLIELAYAGIVSVPPGLLDEPLRYLLLVEVPRQLFPFARGIIANATRDGGFPPLLLQPIDFNALYQQQMSAADGKKAGSPPQAMPEPDGFKDHFSGVAANYKAHRPDYPQDLADHLAKLCRARDLAWDAGCGSGQFSRTLAKRFKKIIGTDASKQQLAEAPDLPNAEFRVAKAEASTLETGSADVATAAQAAHWFDLPAYFAEVKRVVKPGGIIALAGYTPAIGVPGKVRDLFEEFYHETSAAYWPPERSIVEEHYKGIDFPFEEIANPVFEKQVLWNLPQLKGYIETWSAVSEMKKAGSADVFEHFIEKLAAAWGDKAKKLPVGWPFFMRIGRV